MTDPNDHWRSLPSSSWELGERTNKNLRLTDGKLDYFREFLDSSYTNWQMENEHIPESLDTIPTRFESLSEDIGFLEQAGETTEKLWEEMLNINQRAGHLNDTLFSPQTEPENSELQLGYEIGSMLELIMSDSTSKSDRTDVARGLVMAFSGEAREGIDEDRITALEFAHSLSKKHPPQTRATTETINEMYETVGIEYQAEVPIPHALKQQGITHSEYLSDILMGKAEKMTTEHSTSNPEGNVSHTFYETSVPAAEAESLVDHLLQINPELKEFDSLCEPLLEDIHLVETKEYHGTPTIGIANQLWQATRRCAASTIRNFIDTNTSLPYTIHALYCLSGEHNGKLLTSRPIVTEHPDGWNLTDYGDIVTYFLFDIEKELVGSGLQDFVDNPKVHPDGVDDVVFALRLIEFLHRTAVSPATIDPKFVNLMKQMYEDSDSCMDWRDRVSAIDTQD